MVFQQCLVICGIHVFYPRTYVSVPFQFCVPFLPFVFRCRPYIFLDDFCAFPHVFFYFLLRSPCFPWRFFDFSRHSPCFAGPSFGLLRRFNCFPCLSFIFVLLRLISSFSLFFFGSFFRFLCFSCGSFTYPHLIFFIHPF